MQWSLKIFHFFSSSCSRQQYSEWPSTSKPTSIAWHYWLLTYLRKKEKPKNLNLQVCLLINADSISSLTLPCICSIWWSKTWDRRQIWPLHRVLSTMCLVLTIKTCCARCQQKRETQINLLTQEKTSIITHAKTRQQESTQKISINLNQAITYPPSHIMWRNSLITNGHLSTYHPIIACMLLRKLIALSKHRNWVKIASAQVASRRGLREVWKAAPFSWLTPLTLKRRMVFILDWSTKNSAS